MAAYFDKFQPRTTKLGLWVHLLMGNTCASMNDIPQAIPAKLVYQKNFNPTWTQTPTPEQQVE